MIAHKPKVSLEPQFIQPQIKNGQKYKSQLSDNDRG